MEGLQAMNLKAQTFNQKANNKRKMKSAFQIEALERFYNEHKYPSESMKLQFANDIGLSLKQVSGWFCHRRLKDKRPEKDEACGGWKQNLSNDIMNEYSSGVVQESCSSTKDHRPFDPREVESKRFQGLNSPASVRASKKTDRYLRPRYNTHIEGTSDGSSSASQEMLLDVSEKPHASEPSRYFFRDDNCTVINVKGLKSGRDMTEDGYLSLQDEIQNSSVAFLKRKLGRLYQEDGPPLSSDFDPLPPGAFDSPIMDTFNGSTALVSDEYEFVMHPHCSNPEGKGFRKAMRVSQHNQHESSIYPSTSKLVLAIQSNHEKTQTSVPSEFPWEARTMKQVQITM